jgi:phosphoglycolate phosphatase
MKYEHIIFDFNGTLVNSSELMHEILNGLIQKSRFKCLIAKDFETSQKLPLIKKIKMLIFSIKYQPRFLRIFNTRLSELEFADGAKAMLTFLNEKEQPFSILSSNSSDMIVQFFQLHGIQVGSVFKSQWLLGKKLAIKKFMKQKSCNAENMLYIGDEKRDIEVCNKLGVDIIFVKWGFDAGEDISRYDVKAVVQTPEELIGYLV